jgi:hypothetical protein
MFLTLRRPALLCLLGCLLVAEPALGQGSSDDWRSLVGIRRVGILVTVDEELLPHITEARLEEILVEKISAAGVTVVTPQELRDGNLSLALMAMPDVQQNTIVGLFVAKYADFQQGADLRRSPTYAVVTSWADHGIAYWGVSVAREAAEAAALMTAEKFVSDWLIARAQQ